MRKLVNDNDPLVDILADLLYLHLFVTIPDECGPGYFSSTGIAKCFVCPIGTYSSNKRNKACTSCPVGTTTVVSAAKGIEDCGSERCFSYCFHFIILLY